MQVQVHDSFMNFMGPDVFRLRNASNSRKTLNEITPSESFRQCLIIKHTNISAVYYMTIHTKWDKEYNALHVTLGQPLLPHDF